MSSSFALKSRGRSAESAISSPSQHDKVFLFHDITPEDTLPGIALKFRVTVDAIKKANKVYNDSALMAQTSIKIPVQKYGVFSEQAEESNRRREELSASIYIKGDEESQEDDVPHDEMAHSLLSKVEESVSVMKEQVTRTEERMLSSGAISRETSSTRIPRPDNTKCLTHMDKRLLVLIIVMLILSPFLAFTFSYGETGIWDFGKPHVERAHKQLNKTNKGFKNENATHKVHRVVDVH